MNSKSVGSDDNDIKSDYDSDSSSSWQREHFVVTDYF